MEHGNIEKRRMILQVGKYYPPHKGGFETHLQTLALGLRPHFRVGVVVSSHSKKTLRSEEDGVEVVRVATPFHFAGAPVSPSLARILKERPSDLIHIHHPNPYAMMALLQSRVTTPWIVSYHSDVIRQRILGSLFEPILLKILRRSEAIIVSSQTLLDQSSVLPDFKEKCQVIPWGINIERFQNPDTEAVDRVRNRYGDRPMILAVGRMVYYKGFDFLIRAMRNVNAVLVISGDGPLKNDMQKMAKEIAQDRIFLPGEIPDSEIISYFHACDVFVLPSIAPSEAFGIVQLEAMASSKPVVNTDLPTGVPFVSQNNVTGITVPPRDEKALADAMNKLLNQKELAKEFGNAGLIRVREHFSVEKMVGKTIELYNSILQHQVRT